MSAPSAPRERPSCTRFGTKTRPFSSIVWELSPKNTMAPRGVEPERRHAPPLSTTQRHIGDSPCHRSACNGDPRKMSATGRGRAELDPGEGAGEAGTDPYRLGIGSSEPPRG